MISDVSEYTFVKLLLVLCVSNRKGRSDAAVEVGESMRLPPPLSIIPP
jgi:hypothetical protein